MGSHKLHGQPANPAAPAAKEHRLGPGDVVSIQVFGEPELDLRASRLTPGGKITMPLVGEITLTGLTAREASSVVEARLKQGYLVRPNVTVMIGETTRAQFTIMGAVGKQGPYFFPPSGKLTLVEAIASAGGFSREAKQSDVKVARLVNGSEQTIVLDVKGDAKAKNFPILPGDVITIRESLF